MITCSSCHRYVRDESTTCPFCQIAITSVERSAGGQVTPLAPTGRLSRAAVHALRAAMIAAPVSAAACGTVREAEPLDKAEEGTGGVTASGGTIDVSSGGSIELAEGGEGGMGGYDIGVPIYGGPFPDMMKAKV